MKKIIVLVFLFAGFQANAAIIDYGTYTTDTQSGLDWLDLSMTDGKSTSAALAENVGWHLATKDQYVGLISQFEVDGDLLVAGQTCSAPHKNGLNVSCQQPGANSFTSALWFDLFGLTEEINDTDFTIKYSYGAYQDGLTLSLGGVSAADFADDNILDSIYVGPAPSTSYPANFRGNFLVRASTVPEPSILALMGLGIFGIGLSRRRMRK